MHGLADDNVFFKHSEILIEALQKALKPFELMIYPRKAHGLSGQKIRHHVYQTMDAFFRRHLLFSTQSR